jgi:outer membrane protein assembly factor BamB
LLPGSKLGPPLHVGWRFNDGALLEFPPVIYRNTLFFVGDNGWAHAIDRRHGHQLWQRHVGTLAAASPALGVRENLIFIPVLSTHGNRPGGGQFVALSMSTGRLVWSVPIGAGSEASPLAWGPTVYFGDQAGILYSVRARDGHVNWTYHASGAIKGGPALVNGVLYFGDYAGRAYAVNAETGHQVWAVSTNGAHFGFGSGEFYATPAVAFGRVYIGNTDGRVYSFAQRNGELAWATGTGAYVYASAAAQDTPGLGPTVYLGSYNGTFYAFDARSGAVRWTHAAGGRISGSATIVGNVVYYSDLGTKTTAGLDTRTGRQVFSFPDGAFNPVVADTDAIYLVGYQIIYQLLPTSRVKSHPTRRASSHPTRPARVQARAAVRRHASSSH